MRIGPITLGEDYSINLVANGDSNDNITTLSIIHLSIYGTDQGDVYNYTINPDQVEIDELGYVTLVSATGLKKSNEKYVIQ